ncbi:hypothetical protein AC579_6589 [Pseudocercospora musae]|uniref:Uncharacterized protein n=1 Tax=Pseudocercospora musae TaxID=113226 RepID=A0A139I9U1_9PEZI|nr:hypothetical protein AC579_6589 [Pseudocercospora musae]
MILGFWTVALWEQICTDSTPPFYRTSSHRDTTAGLPLSSRTWICTTEALLCWTPRHQHKRTSSPSTKDLGERCKCHRTNSESNNKECDCGSDTSWLTPKVMAGPVKSAVITALLNATAKQVIATTIVHHHLYALDQFFGFAGSPFTKVTSSQRSEFPVLVDLVGSNPFAVSSVYSPVCASAVSVQYGRLTASTGSASKLVLVSSLRIGSSSTFSSVSYDVLLLDIGKAAILISYTRKAKNTYLQIVYMDGHGRRRADA